MTEIQQVIFLLCRGTRKSVFDFRTVMRDGVKILAAGGDTVGVLATTRRVYQDLRTCVSSVSQSITVSLLQPRLTACLRLSTKCRRHQKRRRLLLATSREKFTADIFDGRPVTASVTEVIHTHPPIAHGWYQIILLGDKGTCV